MPNSKLTTSTDDESVELAVDLNVLGDGVIEDLGPLLDDLLGSLNSRLGSLDLDLSTTISARSILGRRNVNDGASVETESLHLTTTGTNQGRKLALSNGHSSRVGVVLDILEQAEKLIAASISAPARTLDDDLVGPLVRATTGRSIARLVVVASLLGAREVDTDVVAVLQTVDLATLRTNQVTVVLCGDVELVSSLVLELLADVKDVLLRGVGLSLGALNLADTFLKLDVDVKFVTKLVDVLTTTSDQVASELLGEVKLEGETTLELVLLLLLDEGKQVLNEGVNVVLRTTEVDGRLRSLLGSRRCLSGATVRDLGRDVLLSKRLVVTVNVPPDLVVELDRRLDVARDNLLLTADEAENVLLRLLQGALVCLSILCAGCLAGKFVVGRGHAVLEHEKGW
jgi:hypothetical protein